METRLLDLLACPLCKGPLAHVRPPFSERHELVCAADRLAFPVRDGIPVMLEQEARSLDEPQPAATPLATGPMLRTADRPPPAAG